MPDMTNFSAAEKEDDQLGRTVEAEEKEEDLDHMDVMEEEEEAEDEEALEEGSKERSQSEEESELEFIGVELEDIRTNVQCPICLGIIRKTRTVMGCLHRFCQECIDKSMRQGNHECPACRKHCASRRSLRADPLFDAFIAATFGDIDTYEDQDLAFDEDELARNKQIQASIAQVSQRQSEALVKTKSVGKDEGVLPRSQSSGSGSRRRRRRSRNMEQETLEAHDNNRGIASSSAEPCAETLPRKRKRRSATRSTAHPSSSARPNNNDNCANNVTEEAHHIDCRAILHGLAWGRGGTRSDARQGNNNQGASSKSVRSARLNRLMEYLGSLESNSV